LKVATQAILEKRGLFTERNSASIQFDVDGKHLADPFDVADEFSEHHQLVYNSPCPVFFSTLSSSSEFLTIVPTSEPGILKLLSA
jgi:hypothetical protein